MFKNSPLNFVNTAVIISIHLAALAAFLTPFNKVYIFLFIFHYLWFGFSSSLYYHRCLTHRSFELSVPLQIFFLIGGMIGLSGDPVAWVAIHRYHHSNPDIPEDSHSPRDGFLYSYLTWQMKIDLKQVDKWSLNSEDIKKIWFIRLAQGVIPSAIVHTSYMVVIYLLFGLPGLLYGFYLPLVLTYQFCWMLIASVCHSPRFGSRRANTPDDSRNVWWLTPVSFGESFHNNHHEKPRRFRHGLNWYDIDFTAWLVLFLEKIKLAKYLVR